MPILDIQKRARELGRIRLGQTVPTTRRDGTSGTRPEKLDRFRLTSPSKPLLEKVAELYGGEVREWQPQGGGASQWEVLTNSNRIPILVPPQPITQWMEHWTGGGCKRRCDTVTEVLSDQPCICKANEDDAPLCKPTTRLNVILRDVEGIGVFRLETHGYNAAIELPDAASFLAQVGGYVEGFLALEERTSKAEVTRNGETKVETRHFMVPTIEISVTPAELMAGKGGIRPPSVEGPVERKQLEAGAADPYADALGLVEAATTLDELGGVWTGLVGDKLLGPEATVTPAYDAFVEAWKVKARAIKAAEGEASSSGSDGDVVDGEIVDQPADGDADAVWQQIIAAAGKLEPPMTTSEVTDDFKATIGVAAAAASAGELTHYLQALRGRQGQPA